MREDMARVVITRPRLAGGLRAGSRRAQRVRMNPEEAPFREGMGRGRGDKFLNEYLQPLARYLEKQRGRPWNAIYSEISRHLRADNPVQQHVRDHLSDFVLFHVADVDGVLVGHPVYGQPAPIAEMAWGPRFYVCPRSGCLRERPHAKRRRGSGRRRKAPGPPTEDTRWDGPTRLLRRIDGVWYALELARIPESDQDLPDLRDALLNRPLEHLVRMPHVLLRQLGYQDFFVKSKRQLGKKELKRLHKLPRNREDVGR